MPFILHSIFFLQGNMLTNDQLGLAGNVLAEIGQQTNLPNQSYLPQPTSANLGEFSNLADTTGQISIMQGIEPSESSSVLPTMSTELSSMSFATQQPSSANQFNPTNTEGNKSSRPVAVVPAAMRSSFLIGVSFIISLLLFSDWLAWFLNIFL